MRVMYLHLNYMKGKKEKKDGQAEGGKDKRRKGIRKEKKKKTQTKSELRLPLAFPNLKEQYKSKCFYISAKMSDTYLTITWQL